MKEFKPKEVQLKLLEAYLNTETKIKITELCNKVGYKLTTYYYDCNNTGFSKWFSNAIKSNADRYAPMLYSSVISSAISDKATTEDKKLALQVLNIWTPTQKTVNLTIEDFLNEQEKELE